MTIEDNLVWLETVWKRTTYRLSECDWGTEEHFEHEYSSLDFRILD